MSLARCELLARRLGFPRASGDEPIVKAQINGVERFSPRERG